MKTAMQVRSGDNAGKFIKSIDLTDSAGVGIFTFTDDVTQALQYDAMSVLVEQQQAVHDKVPQINGSPNRPILALGINWYPILEQIEPPVHPPIVEETTP